MLVRNAVYKIDGQESNDLYHVSKEGHISIAMYRDARGKCKPNSLGKVDMFFSMFSYIPNEVFNHNHWRFILESKGRIVASHVVDPRKLTSRQLRKMARK